MQWGYKMKLQEAGILSTILWSTVLCLLLLVGCEPGPDDDYPGEAIPIDETVEDGEIDLDDGEETDEEGEPEPEGGQIPDPEPVGSDEPAPGEETPVFQDELILDEEPMPVTETVDEQVGPVTDLELTPEDEIPEEEMEEAYP